MAYKELAKAKKVFVLRIYIYIYIHFYILVCVDCIDTHNIS